jgi:hypothetical protein
MEVTMKKLTNTLFIAFLLSSCTHYYYLQNIQNVPLFKGKNEYRLSASLGTGRASASTDVQAAYSVSDHIGIMTNFMSARGGDKSRKDWSKGNYLEGAIGYFKPIDAFGEFEVYTGFGGGRQHHEYSMLRFSYVTNEYYRASTGYSDLSYNKFFVQPSYGVTFNAFDVAFSTRIGGLFYHNIVNRINQDDEDYDELYDIAQKEDYFFLEPALTLRGGWKYIKIQFQAAYTGFINQPDVNFERTHVSLGIYVPIAKRFRLDAPVK